MEKPDMVGRSDAGFWVKTAAFLADMVGFVDGVASAVAENMITVIQEDCRVEEKQNTISHNMEIDTRSCSTGHRNKTLVCCRVEDRKNAISHDLEIDMKNGSRGFRNETLVS